jgi:hypothetical protein
MDLFFIPSRADDVFSLPVDIVMTEREISLLTAGT